MTDCGKKYVRKTAITLGLEASALLSSLATLGRDRGRGAIFTLHHVRPRSNKAFDPNALLEVTPEFLDVALRTLADEGYDFIRLEDMPARLSGDPRRPFACFTLDDGYRDNAVFAAEVFSRHAAPFTVFLTGGFIDGTRSMWWETLDAALNLNDSLTYDFGRGPETMIATTVREKGVAFGRVATHINASDENAAVAALDREAARLGVDPLQITSDLAMRKEELVALLANPLVSYGAHTLTHRGIARLPAEESRAEIAGSAEVVTAITGRPPTAFAYPYGDARSVAPRERQALRDLGIVGLTTRPGTLRAGMADDMTALPRISLNGLYQKARYVRALASGIPFRLTGAR